MATTDTQSPAQYTWQRLKRNRPAMVSLAFIVLCVLTAIFGYVLVPDDTPDANNQIPEISLQSPGFVVKLLQVRQNRVVERPGLLRRLWSGKPTVYQSIPILRYEVRDTLLDVVTFGGYLPDGSVRDGRYLTYRVVDVLYALSNTESVTYRDSIWRVPTLQSGLIESTPDQARSQLEEHIVDRTYWLGTDAYGRSMLSRLLLSARISLLVGFIAVCISLSLGVLLGALAGYIGGRIDDVILLLINSIWSVPTLLLVFAIVLALGQSVGVIFLAVGLTMWVDVARIVRGQILGLKRQQYVEAAQAFGYGTRRILLRHLLPNVLGPVMVVAAANFAMAILLEAGLSYLGFGVQPPTPSWGTMLNENYGYAVSGRPLLAFAPALAIVLMVLSFNVLGNGLRDAIDVKL